MRAALGLLRRRRPNARTWSSGPIGAGPKTATTTTTTTTTPNAWRPTTLVRVACAVGVAGGFGVWRAGRVAPRDIAFDLDHTLIVSHPLGFWPLPEPRLVPPGHEGLEKITADPDADSDGHMPPPDLATRRYEVRRRPKALWAIGAIQRMGMRTHLYTAATQSYTDEIVDRLLPGCITGRRLYRPQCVDPRGHGKDLARVVFGTEAARVASTVLVDDRVSNRVGHQHLYAIRAFGDVAGSDGDNGDGHRRTQERILSRAMRDDRELVYLVAWCAAARVLGLPPIEAADADVAAGAADGKRRSPGQRSSPTGNTLPAAKPFAS
jgi:hypothetical protein